VTVSTRSIAEALAAVVGRQGVVDDPAALAADAVDGLRPRWSARPRAVEQVAGVLALAAEESLAVVPRGSGSALDLGHPPARVDIVLDLRRMDRIVDYNPDDLTASVEAGVTAERLAARLADRRQLLPVDPPGAASRTLGGLAATAAAGPLRARYGTLRDLLLGVRFVQADGTVTWGGARVVKSVTGYDVPKLMVGSLGTLGVLAELTLRLHPLPEAEATCLLEFQHAETAPDVVARLVDSVVQPHRLELLDAAALAACGLPAAAAGLVVSVGSVEAAVRTQQAIVAAEGARLRARVETMGPGFWRTYDRVLATAGPTVLRIATLATRLGPTLGEVRAALGADAVITACAPLGVLRAALRTEDPAPLATAIERLRAFVGADDGSVVIERGSAALRAAVDPWGPVAPGPLELMRALKRQFDPRGTLNPGRFAGGI
jgi:glycolate dehydrogenase FAD-binding subunit